MTKSQPTTTDAYAPSPRQRKLIYLACTVLIGCALVLIFVANPKIPLPARLILAAINLIAAATLVLLVRQKSQPPV
jgi:hypothetical protein